jgi:hypothetical protein
MDKSNPPTTFGVFKPVGHTLMAFATEAELQSAVVALKSMGFADASMVHYAPAEMAAQVEAQLLESSPLATFGYELDLIRAHGALAKQGCSFLLVDAPTDALATQVAALVKTIQPATAQHYGLVMIENLTEQRPGRLGETQTPV